MLLQLERLLDFFSDKEPVPNKFTIALGKLVRDAREEAGLSQSRLASMIHRRRATISDIENGKSEVTIPTLTLLASSLDKPITYFLPWFIYENLKPEELEPAEHELFIQFRKIFSDDLKRLAIQQVNLIAETDIKDFKEKLRKEIANNPPIDK